MNHFHDGIKHNGDADNETEGGEDAERCRQASNKGGEVS
jgi:hypothetical protein